LSAFIICVVTMSLPSRLSLLIFIVLLIYYPALFAETCLLDDRGMLLNLSGMQHFDLRGIFFPHSQGGLYYRPMIAVSFLIDRFAWNLDPTIMHLENILLHLASAFLIFFIARLIISKDSKLPLLAALVFGVHPIATESVNWISGRTDLLAVMFILASLYSVLRFQNSRRLSWLILSAVTLLMGILAKETAIGFVPALVFILTTKKDGDVYTTNELPGQRHLFIAFFSACLLALAAALFLFNYYLAFAIVVLYFFYLLWSRREKINRKYVLLFSSLIIALSVVSWGIRKMVFSTQSPQIRRTFGILFSDMNYTISLFFRGAGFYAKKFIYPLPLNLVIRDVSPMYALLGIIILCLLAVMSIRRKLPDSLVIAGFWMIVPVLPLTFESIAWTSYAERYVYPAAPFWILSLAGYAASAGFDRLSSRKRSWCLAGLSLLIVAIAVSTFQRNLVWRTNIALFRDSVEKTPDYKRVRSLYAAALYEKGLYDEALRQYRVAESLPSLQLKYNPYDDLFYVQILIAKREFEKAEQELDNIDKKTNGNEPGVYEGFAEIAPRMMLTTDKATEKQRIATKLVASYDRWFKLTKNPMILYREGQLLLTLNKKREAGEVFARAAAVFPKQNLYRGFSEKLAGKLAKGA